MPWLLVIEVIFRHKYISKIEYWLKFLSNRFRYVITSTESSMSMKVGMVGTNENIWAMSTGWGLKQMYDDGDRDHWFLVNSFRALALASVSNRPRGYTRGQIQWDPCSGKELSQTVGILKGRWRTLMMEKKQNTAQKL